MKLTVLAKDFKESEDFGSNCDCPLAKAAKRQFGTNDVSEEVNELIVGIRCFKHREFDKGEHDELKRKALTLADDVVVLEMELEEI